ncbi:hypothetical protein [Escherichia coli]|uniref:hypothetical protein n=1 Tax=Escherichia coli TaxID=562 RepID=UPI0024800CB0|nr:hypothetical protein [Escherichia coli]WGT25146.1 hypothetical protein QC817_22920 [Escherichia coli]
MKTISVSAALKTSDNTPLAVLYASQLRKKDGSIATGKQDAVLTVRKDAAFGVTMNGVSAAPGRAKTFSWISVWVTAAASLFFRQLPALAEHLNLC